jgi:drug/metabolite transporter (DMT)-like permease
MDGSLHSGFLTFQIDRKLWMSLQNWKYLVVLSILWGGTFFFVEVALEDFTPLTLVFARVSLASIVLLGIIIFRGENITTDAFLWGRYMIMGVMNNAIPFSLIFWEQLHITGSVASILNATTPIFAVLVTHIFTQDEKINTKKLAGVLLGFAGVSS